LVCREDKHSARGSGSGTGIIGCPGYRNGVIRGAPKKEEGCWRNIAGTMQGGPGYVRKGAGVAVPAGHRDGKPKIPGQRTGTRERSRAGSIHCYPSCTIDSHKDGKDLMVC
jgi:hypothetical protein